MSLTDRIALCVCLAAFFTTAYVANHIYKRLPHIEDEMAFIWQGRLIACRKLTALSPQPNPDSFLVPFAVDYHDQLFSKYPIGWPVVLAAGELVRARHLINPLLTAAVIWLIYRLDNKMYKERVALLAACLGAISPFVILIGGSLLSHSLTLVLTLIFMIGWLDSFYAPNPSCPDALSGFSPQSPQRWPRAC